MDLRKTVVRLLLEFLLRLLLLRLRLLLEFLLRLLLLVQLLRLLLLWSSLRRHYHN